MSRRHYKVRGGGVLPAGYAECEYIESTGTQWIDTGVIPNNLTGLSFNISSLFYDRKDFNFIGCRTQNYRFMVNSMDFREVNSGFGKYNHDAVIKDLTQSSPINISMNLYNDRKFIVDGIAFRENMPSWVSSEYLGNIFFFTQGTYGQQIDRSYIYRLNNTTIISQGIEPIRYYKPCVRLADNKPGMYDLCGSICPLTGTPFYVNAGTGEFLYQLKS